MSRAEPEPRLAARGAGDDPGHPPLHRRRRSPTPTWPRSCGTPPRAPSGTNRQPFRFIVLRRDDPRPRPARALLARSFRESWVDKRADLDRDGAPAEGSPRARMQATMQHFVDHLDEMPVIVLVGLERYRPANPYEGASVYPACQNLLLAARALGYGGALTGGTTPSRPSCARCSASPTASRCRRASRSACRPGATDRCAASRCGARPRRPLGPRRRRGSGTGTVADDPYAVLGVDPRRSRGRSCGPPGAGWPRSSTPTTPAATTEADAPAQPGLRRARWPHAPAPTRPGPQRPADGADVRAAARRPCRGRAGGSPTTSPRSRSRRCRPRRSRRCSSWPRGSARCSSTTRRTSSTSRSGSRSTAGAGSTSCPTPAPAPSPSRSASTRRPPRPRPRRRPRRLGRRPQHPRPPRLTPIRVFASRSAPAPSGTDTRTPQTLGWRSAGGGLRQAVADGVAEAARRGEDGDDAVGAGGVGGAQRRRRARGRRRRGRRRGRATRDPAARRARTRRPAPSAAARSGDEHDAAPRGVVRGEHPGGPRRSAGRRRAPTSSRRSTSSVGMPPGRSSCGGSVVQSTIVLSTPIGLGPPSSTTSRPGRGTGRGRRRRARRSSG